MYSMDIFSWLIENMDIKPFCSFLELLENSYTIYVTKDSDIAHDDPIFSEPELTAKLKQIVWNIMQGTTWRI